MTSSRLVLPAVVLLVGGACGIVGPDQGAPQLPIVLSVEPGFADVLADVDGASLRITRLGHSPRDTTLLVQNEDGLLYARLLLRPDEGSPGTRLELTLFTGTYPLFRGRAQLSGADESQIRLALEPVATFEVGEGHVLALGDVLLLGALRTIVFVDGRARPSTSVSWLSKDPTIVEIVADRALTRSEGTTDLIGVWSDRSDTMSVRVAPSGRIVLADTFPRFYLAPTDEVFDTIGVDQDTIGHVGPLDASVGPAFPWLTAQLSAPTPPAELLIHIDGSSLPESGGPGEILLSSLVPGVHELVVRVDARREPSTGVESRTWSPFCIIGDSVDVSLAGRIACMELRARAWTEADMRRVVLEARNLLGSRGDSLDTASRFDLMGFGINVPSPMAAPELLAVRTNGSVGHVGYPALRHLAGFRVTGDPFTTSIVGCARAENPHAFVTCDPTGHTGSIRADFQVADTSWSLADALATMDPYFHGYAINNCTDGSRYCHVR